METHVKVLAVLHIVLGALGVLIGLGVFAGLVHLDADPDAAVAIPILGGIGEIVLIVLLVLSVPGIIVGVGLLSFRPWSRILAIVLSILHILNIPFGTAIDIYSLWVLFSNEGARFFEPRTVASVPR